MQKLLEEIKQGGKSSILRKILKYLGYLIIFIFAMQIGQLWMQRDVVIGKAPAISGVDIDGVRVALTDYRGKPVLLYFWATWCPICRFEHGVVTNLAEDYPVISVVLQSGKPAEVKAEMQMHNAKYRVINDPDGDIAARYGIRGVPTSFIIDSSGNIRTTLSGYTSELSLRYQLWRLMPNID